MNGLAAVAVIAAAVLVFAGCDGRADTAPEPTATLDIAEVGVVATPTPTPEHAPRHLRQRDCGGRRSETLARARLHDRDPRRGARVRLWPDQQPVQRTGGTGVALCLRSGQHRPWSRGRGVRGPFGSGPTARCSVATCPRNMRGAVRRCWTRSSPRSVRTRHKRSASRARYADSILVGKSCRWSAVRSVHSPDT